MRLNGCVQIRCKTCETPRFQPISYPASSGLSVSLPPVECTLTFAFEYVNMCMLWEFRTKQILQGLALNCSCCMHLLSQQCIANACCHVYRLWSKASLGELSQRVSRTSFNNELLSAGNPLLPCSQKYASCQPWAVLAVYIN